MKMMLVIDMNATSKKVVYHATINEQYALLYSVENFFEQAEIEVDYRYVEMIADDLECGYTFNYKNFHFEMMYV